MSCSFNYEINQNPIQRDTFRTQKTRVDCHGSFSGVLRPKDPLNGVRPNNDKSCTSCRSTDFGAPLRRLPEFEPRSFTLKGWRGNIGEFSAGWKVTLLSLNICFKSWNIFQTILRHRLPTSLHLSHSRIFSMRSFFSWCTVLHVVLPPGVRTFHWKNITC